MWGKHPFVKGCAFTKMGVASEGSQHANKTNIFIWSPPVALSGNRRPKKIMMPKIINGHVFSHAFSPFKRPCVVFNPPTIFASSVAGSRFMRWVVKPAILLRKRLDGMVATSWGNLGDQESCWASACLMNKHGGIMECIMECIHIYIIINIYIYIIYI